MMKRAYLTLKGEPPLTPGELDLAELSQLLGKTDPLILEIGCNDGNDTKRFLETFPQVRIFCFEPDARAQHRFADNVHSDRVKLYPIAIGEADGTAEFYASSGAPSSEWADKLPEGWDLSGSIRPPKKHQEVHPWCQFAASGTVEVRSLDSWAAEEGIDAVDFIWADVQGAEVDLIRGGKRTLARTRYFYTEYNDQEMYEGQIDLKTLLHMLTEFEVVHRFQSDVLLRNKNACCG